MTLDGRVGGSPFNVAVGLARLGVHTTFLASLSRGFLGDRLLRALREEGMATEAVGTVVGREQADEAARVERFAQAVFYRPAAAEIEGGLGADGVALDVQAVVCLARGEAAVAVERAVAREARADEERRARIDVGDLANHAVADRDGHRQQRRRLVVECLQREAHIAVVELLRDVGADLAAVGRAEAGEPASNGTLSSSRALGAMPTCLQALGVAAVPMRDLRQLRVADEDDALAAPVEQVLRGERATGHVVVADGAVQLLRHLRAPDHDGHVPRCELVELVVMAPLSDQDHADGHAGIDDTRCQLEALGIDARGQHVEVALGQGIGQAAEHREEERIGDVLARRLVVRDHDGDGAVVFEARFGAATLIE